MVPNNTRCSTDLHETATKFVLRYVVWQEKLVTSKPDDDGLSMTTFNIKICSRKEPFFDSCFNAGFGYLGNSSSSLQEITWFASTYVCMQQILTGI